MPESRCDAGAKRRRSRCNSGEEKRERKLGKPIHGCSVAQGRTGITRMEARLCVGSCALQKNACYSRRRRPNRPRPLNKPSVIVPGSGTTRKLSSALKPLATADDSYIPAKAVAAFVKSGAERPE